MSCSLPQLPSGFRDNNVLVIAFYYIGSIADVDAEVKAHKSFLKVRDVTARIYISHQGINAQMSASHQAAVEYMEWLSARFPGSHIDFKLHTHPEHAFPRLTIKKKKELVALGVDLPLETRGQYMTPKEWKEELDNSDSDKIVLDVRNDYEWKLGHFQGSYLFACQTFKEFLASLEELKKKITPQTKVLMYCTGGIRCELFSSLLMQEGIQNIFQLQGGVIRYGLDEKSKHWLGKLFVFDDRLSVPISDEATVKIGKCHHCGTEAESYYNCANMDCNELFLCCPSCLEKYRGCCKDDCMTAERVRPFQHAHKPFRRWYHYQNDMKCKGK